MNTAQRIAKNTVVLLVSDIISKVLGFFYIVYTARYLGAEGFGILSFALAFTGIFGVFTDLGLQQLTIREVARNKSLASKYLGNIAIIKLILVTLTFGLIVLTINLLGYPKKTIEVVYLIALSILSNAFVVMFNSIFQAFERMEYVSFGRILNSSLMLVGALYAIRCGFDVVGFASIYLITNLVVLIYSLTISIWRFAKPKIEVDLNFWKTITREALPFGLSSIFIIIYYWIDSVMLSLLKGNEVVGWYNAAYRLVLILLSIPLIINAAIYPVMSRYYITSQNSLKLICEKYFKIMLIIGIPIGVGITLLADKIILLIFGADYKKSIIALQILIWGVIFIFANAAFVKLFESINKQIIVSKVTGIAMVLNIILNSLLIPKFSYIGASVATLITEFTVALMVIVWGFKLGYGVSKDTVTSIFKIVIGSLIIGVFIKQTNSILGLFATVILSTAIYLVFLLISKGIDNEDIILFKKMFSKERVK